MKFWSNAFKLIFVLVYPVIFIGVLCRPALQSRWGEVTGWSAYVVVTLCTYPAFLCAMDLWKQLKIAITKK